MKFKNVLLLLACLFLLSACTKEKMKDPITLVKQDNSKITFPQKKPTLLFFITTYT
jgi:hypothetical protein